MRGSAASPRLLVAVALVALPLAGCLGGAGSGPGADPGLPGDAGTGNDTGLLPGNGTDADAVRPHVHDRWEGQAEKVVFDDVVSTGSSTQVEPGQTVLDAFFCAFTCSATADFALPEGEIVPPGTSEVEVSATWGADDPAYSGTQAALRWQAANMSEWRTEDLEASGHTWTINTTVEMADEGHAQFSLWRFGFFICGQVQEYCFMPRMASQEMDIQVTIVARRVEGELPLEPPHPDWWANGTVRDVWTAEGQGSEVGAVFFSIGTDGNTGEFADGEEHDVVPPGTRLLALVVNWTNDGAAADAAPVRPYAAWSNQGGFFGEFNEWEPQVAEPGHYVFTLPVTERMVDGMYAEESRWAFFTFFDGEDTGVDEPVFGVDLRQPYQFDGSWQLRLVATNATEPPADLVT